MAKSKIRKNKNGAKVSGKEKVDSEKDSFYWNFAAADEFLSKGKAGELEKADDELSAEGERLLNEILFPSGRKAELLAEDELFAVRSVAESVLEIGVSKGDASLFSANETWLLK